MSPSRRTVLTTSALAGAGLWTSLSSSWAARFLRDRLGAPPTTGLMMIDLCAASGLSTLSLYGFDFFQSLSLTGSRTAEQVPHDFGAERRFVDELVARDARVTIVGR